MGATVTVNAPARKPDGRAMLFIVLAAEEALVPGSRHDLEGVTLVQVKRGPVRRVQRLAEMLIVELADARVSEPHACLVPEASQWFVTDLGSKNGVRVNGAPVRRARLADGDVVEIGHTFLLFRAAQPVADDGPGLAGPERPAGMVSLSPLLAERFAAVARAATSPLTV